MSTAGFVPPAAIGCSGGVALRAAGPRAVKSAPPLTKATTSRPPSDAATTGCEPAPARPASTRAGACHSPPTSRETKTWSTPPSRRT